MDWLVGFGCAGLFVAWVLAFGVTLTRALVGGGSPFLWMSFAVLAATCGLLVGFVFDSNRRHAHVAGAIALAGCVYLLPLAARGPPTCPFAVGLFGCFCTDMTSSLLAVLRPARGLWLLVSAFRVLGALCFALIRPPQAGLPETTWWPCPEGEGILVGFMFGAHGGLVVIGLLPVQGDVASSLASPASVAYRLDWSLCLALTLVLALLALCLSVCPRGQGRARGGGVGGQDGDHPLPRQAWGVRPDSQVSATETSRVRASQGSVTEASQAPVVETSRVAQSFDVEASRAQASQGFAVETSRVRASQNSATGASRAAPPGTPLALNELATADIPACCV